MEDKIIANESLDSQITRDRIGSYIMLWLGTPTAFIVTVAALLKTYDVIPLTVNYTIQGIMFIVFFNMLIWGYRKSKKTYMALVRELRFRGETVIIDTEKYLLGKEVSILRCRVKETEVMIAEDIWGFVSHKSKALLMNDGQETFIIVLEFYPEGTKELILSNIQGK